MPRIYYRAIGNYRLRGVGAYPPSRELRMVEAQWIRGAAEWTHEGGKKSAMR